MEDPLDRLYDLVGDRIRAARKRKGVSQSELAGRLGLSRTSIVNIEAGRQRPPLHVLWRISEELDTEVPILLPSHRELADELQSPTLDADTAAQIEQAAQGDPQTRRDLVKFIQRARSKAHKSS